MLIIHSLLLSILKDSICENKSIDPGVSPKEWSDLMHLAKQQDILPLIVQNVFSCNSFITIDKSFRNQYRDQALSIAIRQITQTNEFLTLILHAQEQGLDPIVLKGIICRNLYPQPYLRPSVDEDILVSEDEVAAVHRFLLSEGLFADDPSLDPMSTSEISYHKENSPTYIEMQKALFDPDSEVFCDFNRLLEGAMNRTIRIQIEDVSVRTLAPTDHLLYLILHAFKHFVHSGIGIRAVCDIGMFADHYSKNDSENIEIENAASIDWAHIRRCLEQVHAFDFARALFHIIKQYLLPDADFFSYINTDNQSSETLAAEGVSVDSDWNIEEIDVEPLLEDILAGGVHGNSTLERLHSSNITLDAIARERASQNNGSEASSENTGFLRTAFHSVFLPLGKMSSRYPYLKKAPFLLPVAWGQRIFGYLKERAAARDIQHSDNSVTSKPKSGAAESIRLGQSRVELLKKYGII